MRPAHRLMAGAFAAGALAAGALVTAGCAQSSDPVDPIERLGRKAAQKVGPHASGPHASAPHASHVAPGASGASGPGAVRLARPPREMCPGERPLTGTEGSDADADAGADTDSAADADTDTEQPGVNEEDHL
ncbi:hypothetical protein [Streptomyces sp. NPDC056244]|uniref:hypothetical protein n=1 Tax=Streptomyces sp. NPDC056244 TaxID=3345762 RepID=UPI0035DAF777